MAGAAKTGSRADGVPDSPGSAGGSVGAEMGADDRGKPDQKALDRITLAEAKQYLAEGHFAPGSMKPKIEAVIEFLEGGGQEAIITDPAHLVDAVEGKAGTRIVR